MRVGGGAVGVGSGWLATIFEMAGEGVGLGVVGRTHAPMLRQAAVDRTRAQRHPRADGSWGEKPELEFIEMHGEVSGL